MDVEANAEADRSMRRLAEDIADGTPPSGLVMLARSALDRVSVVVRLLTLTSPTAACQSPSRGSRAALTTLSVQDVAALTVKLCVALVPSLPARSSTRARR